MLCAYHCWDFIIIQECSDKTEVECLTSSPLNSRHYLAELRLVVLVFFAEVTSVHRLFWKIDPAASHQSATKTPLADDKKLASPQLLCSCASPTQSVSDGPAGRFNSSPSCLIFSLSCPQRVAGGGL